MSDMTPTNAFAHAPASADKTALIAEFTNLLAALDTAETNGTLTDEARIQLKNDAIDLAENIASNLQA